MYYYIYSRLCVRQVAAFNKFMYIYVRVARVSEREKEEIHKIYIFKLKTGSNMCL